MYTDDLLFLHSLYTFKKLLHVPRGKRLVDVGYRVVREAVEAWVGREVDDGGDVVEEDELLVLGFKRVRKEDSIQEFDTACAVHLNYNVIIRPLMLNLLL